MDLVKRKESYQHGVFNLLDIFVVISGSATVTFHGFTVGNYYNNIVPTTHSFSCPNLRRKRYVVSTHYGCNCFPQIQRQNKICLQDIIISKLLTDIKHIVVNQLSLDINVFI